MRILQSAVTYGWFSFLFAISVTAISFAFCTIYWWLAVTGKEFNIGTVVCSRRSCLSAQIVPIFRTADGTQFFIVFITFVDLILWNRCIFHFRCCIDLLLQFLQFQFLILFLPFRSPILKLNAKNRLSLWLAATKIYVLKIIPKFSLEFL